MEIAIIGLLGVLLIAASALAMKVGTLQSNQESMKTNQSDMKKDIQDLKKLFDAFLRANGVKRE